MAEETGVAKPYSDEDKIHLLLAYFGIFALIPFLMFKDKRSDPQKEYVYWHARQGLALAIVVFGGVAHCTGWTNYNRNNRHKLESWKRQS